MDEWRRTLVVGHLSVRDSMKGTLREGSLLGNLKDEVFDIYAKSPVNGPLSIGGLLGNLEGVICQD
jgi:hypothetical protein